MLNYLLLVLPIIALSAATRPGSSFCTGPAISKTNILSVDCENLVLPEDKPLQLENQTSQNLNVSLVKLISVTGNVHPSTLDLFPNTSSLSIAQSNITNLHLPRNRIRDLGIVDSTFPTVTRHSLESCKRLVALVFIGNPNLLFELGAFQDLKELATLYILDQTIPRLQTGFLKGQEHLKYLRLTRCGIREVDSDALYDAPNLKELHLEINPLDHFEPGTFLKSTNLEYLSLLDTLIQKVTPDIFGQLTKLRRVNLPGKTVTKTQPDEFTRAFPKLKKLGIYRQDLRCEEIRLAAYNLSSKRLQVELIDFVGDDVPSPC